MDMIQRIEIRMRELGLNANSLANKMGKTQSTVWSLLSGRTKTFRDLPRLAVALETTTEWLLTGKDDNIMPNTSKNNDILIEAVLQAALKSGESPARKLIEMAKRDLRIWLDKDTETGTETSLDQLVRLVRLRLGDMT